MVFAHAGFWIFQALKIVDRAAVDLAVDLARTLLSGAQGPGPGTQFAPRDPGAAPCTDLP